jgi:hypothetical protein
MRAEFLLGSLKGIDHSKNKGGGRLRGNIKWILGKYVWSEKWINLAGNMVKWRAPVTSCETISLSRRAACVAWSSLKDTVGHCCREDYKWLHY